MTDKKITELSRRKLLGGLGAIGVASAGAGLGTTAFFSDEEGFENNTIQAGAVELRMDWQQSYYTGMPGQDPEDHTTWDQLNAYPDLSGDGVQDRLYTRLEIQEDPTLAGLSADASPEEVEAGYRGQFASFDGTETDGTGNHEFVGPVINLDDVKPGDRGEITISKHVFDNPAYLWLNASNFRNDIGGLNEPKREALLERYEAENLESDDPTDQELIDFAAEQEQLAKEIEATLWYDDNCDNFFDEGEPSCVQLAIDVTDSMGSPEDDTKADNLVDGLMQWVNDLSAVESPHSSIEPFSIGITTKSNTADTQFTPTNDVDTIKGDDEGSFSSSTGLEKLRYQSGGGSGTEAPLTELIPEAADALAECPEDTQRVLVLVTNGVGIGSGELVTVAGDNLRINGGEVDKYIIVGIEVGSTSQGILEEIETFQESKFILVPRDQREDIGTAVNGPTDGLNDPMTSIAEEIGFTADGEQAIFQGSLYDLLTQPAPVNSDGTVDDYEVDGIAGGYPLDSDRNREGRQCYPNSSTRCIALEWHLPFEVGNEIQGDSVVFDLDFYAEQCRHNEGAVNPYASD